jgi:hypothetical protein
MSSYESYRREFFYNCVIDIPALLFGDYQVLFWGCLFCDEQFLYSEIAVLHVKKHDYSIAVPTV